MKQQLLKISLGISLCFALCLPAHSTVKTGLIGQGYDNSGGHTFESYDFNNDGTNDLSVRLIVISSSSYKLVVKGLNGTKVETSSGFLAKAYNAGNIMGSGIYLDSAFLEPGNFPASITERYVGFKFMIAGQYCCAYLEFRLLSYSAPAFDVLWYGYETNSAICIGADATTSLGVAGQSRASEFRVFPNPSTGGLNILLNQSGPVSVEILNTSGQCVLRQHITQASGSKQEPIKLTLPQSGIYFVRVSGANGSKTERVAIY